MANITLNAAPGLSSVTYSVEYPIGTFGAAQTDAVEVQISGQGTGVYQAAEPANWVGVLWQDGQGGSTYAANDLPAPKFTFVFGAGGVQQS